MKSSILAIAVSPVLFTLSAFGQLTTTVPPPPCLYKCIQKFGDCSLCTPQGNTDINACIAATCGNPPKGDKQYAYLYYNSICSEGGYLDYTTTPPHYVTIPPTTCP